eukprot:CAMPEP_0182441102 /NCGR_PEP_ID=MMETSP1172-20130603/55_1 /TAXON_ID=708627 /ORGANISM="Timspurckia oligopyrenoides, Strain CCMP3278" /LENGTH=319 /DNA_ID=CAMNT_0024635247 /DNA_START=202 /DNA_END=1161 /DNA_ORIENTATION=+
MNTFSGTHDFNPRDLGDPGSREYMTTVRQTMKSFRSSLIQCKNEPTSIENDLVFECLRNEARYFINTEPLLASQMFRCVLNPDSFSDAMSYVLANALTSEFMQGIDLLELCKSAFLEDSNLESAVREDLLAAVERNPAAAGFLDVFLYSKGFHAIQSYRVAHHLWKRGLCPSALIMQAQMSKCFQVDIHPAAKLGCGLFLDHATCVVIGETAVVGNNVSLMQHVTLGGVGRLASKRHPTIRNGVLVAAGASIFGNITVGEESQVGACSQVFSNVHDGVTVVGVPAKPVDSNVSKSAFLPSLILEEGNPNSNCILHSDRQ